MPLTDSQRHVLMELVRHPKGRPFREPAEKTAMDELCRMVPPLVCDPHKMNGGAEFTRITDEGRDAILDDKTAVERMSDREISQS